MGYAVAVHAVNAFNLFQQPERASSCRIGVKGLRSANNLERAAKGRRRVQADAACVVPSSPASSEQPMAEMS